MSRQLYFVIAVDLDEKSKSIDDDVLMARFGRAVCWDDSLEEWVVETDEEYAEALEILNNKDKELN
jgi:hypothetical protein